MESWKTKKHGHISMAETSITVMIKINVCVSELGLNMCTGMSRGVAPGKLAECSECYAIGGNYDSDEICASELELNMCAWWGSQRVACGKL